MSRWKFSMILGMVIPSILAAQQIEVAVQKGHSADITFVTFNSNGRLMASSGEDHLIKLWHIPTGKEMASFVSGVTLPVTSMRFTEGDDYLHVLFSDGSIQTWDVAKSALASTRPPEVISFPRQHIYFTADSAYVFLLDGFYLRKKDRRQNKTLFSKVPVDISQNFSALAVNEAMGLVIGACRDGKIYVYDIKKGKSLATLEDHFASVHSISFAPNGKVFASSSADRSIIIWDSQSLRPLKRLFSRSFRFESMAFDPGGSLLAVGDELGKVRIIDLKSSRVKVSTFPLHGQKVGDIKFSRDGQSLYSAGYDNRLVTFDVAQEKIRETRKYKNYWSMSDLVLKGLGAHRDPYAWLTSIAVSPTGRFVVAGGAWREAYVRKQPQDILFHDVTASLDKKLKSHQGGLASLAFVNEYIFLSGFGQTLYQWYYNPVGHGFFFRENQLGEQEDIRGIVPFGKDTVLINSSRALLWFDRATEQVFRTESSPTKISAFSADYRTGKLAFAEFNDVIMMDVRKPEQARRVLKSAHTDKITAMAFSPSRPLLATTGWDATIKLWNTETGELLATIIPVGNEDHIIITPDNYYFGTRQSLRGLGFKYGKQFISPEQFDLRFNRPDIVLGKLGFASANVLKSYHRAYQKRLHKMNFTEQMLGEEIHLPEVQVMSDNIPLHTAENALSFLVRAQDSKYALDRVNVFVNNVPVYGLGGIDLRGRETKSVQEQIDVKLVSGKNKIQFSCLNEKGVESLLETYEVECSAELRKPSLYLAVISVSNYVNKTMNLKYAVKDGRDLVNLLSNKRSLFDKIVIDTLFNEEATKEKILNLKSQLNKSSVDDQVVVFISGHGLLDDNLDFYFGTNDVDFGDPSLRGLKYEDLESLLDGIPARKKLLLMDACHSGEVDKSQMRVLESQTLALDKNQKGTLKTYTYTSETAEASHQVEMKTSFELMQELFANVSKGSGSVVISAAAGNSYALESDEWRNGVFTYSLLAGLKSGGADQNGDGDITVTELKNFVGKEVERLTKGAQKPTSRQENLEFDFVIFER